MAERSEVRIRIKGIKKVRSKGRVYYYAWVGGPRIDAEPGTPKFLKLYNEAVASLRIAPKSTLMSLIAEYRGSQFFQKKADKTRREYLRYLRTIEDKFGTMPSAALEDPKVRGVFLRWRDEIAATSGERTADGHWGMLKLVFNFAVDRGELVRNPCERGGRLYESDRSDKVWGEAEIGAMLSICSAELKSALILALWTGQRQGDLLVLPWSSYDGKYITLRQRKSRGKRKVVIPVGAPLKGHLDELKKVGPLILNNTKGQPWTEDGFRTSWGKAAARAKIEDLTFHDLRGTAVTRLALAGATTPEIATITGHALKDVERILERYLDRNVALAERAIAKLEANELRTKTGKLLENSGKPVPLCSGDDEVTA
jgi:integrase